MLQNRYLHRACVAALIWSSILLGSRSVKATTYRRITVTCPLCQEKAQAIVAGSTFIPGATPDGRPLGVGVDMTLASIIMCRKCGFTAASDRFENPAGIDKDKARASLAAVKSPPLFLKLDRAVAVESASPSHPQMLAHLKLAAKWMADDTGEPETIQTRLAEAIKAHDNLLSSGNLNPEAKASVTYLLGELYRQAGDRAKAIEWFKRAEALMDGRMVPMVQRQSFLAQYTGAKPDAVLAAARQSSDGGKLAAVALLRESDDKDVLAFLKEFCLTCPEDLREEAIYALVDRQPRRVHLPIYLEGLHNEHFRTVQGSASAVELLHATEAAPRIVEALQKPVGATEFRLAAALAAVATEAQIDFLAPQLQEEKEDDFRLPRRRRPAMQSDQVLAALLRTRSEKAVPHILRAIKTERFFYYGRDNHLYDDAAAFGAALLDRLPSLKTAQAEDPLAMFKAVVLGVSKSPKAADELASALDRDDDIALSAALALARRGDARGKPVLLKNLQHVRTQDTESIAFLYPLVTPADFEPIRRTMESEKAQRKETLRQEEADLRERLNDPNTSDSDKQSARRELARLEWDEDFFLGQWIALLAATRNPQACPICMELLDSPSDQWRAAAAEALAYVYDNPTGDALARRLESESEYVRPAIIRTFGKAKDTRQIPILLKLVEQPTLASTKIAWIETMLVLSPDAARPNIARWRTSPHPELAMAAAKAIGASK